MVLQVRGRRLDSAPESLAEFFESNPEVAAANVALTEMEHTSMWREEVLFIKQRQQATSDYRENQKVRWIGSHAALTCHIAVMRHVETGVSSIGHFDNFCCWQFGKESDAHKDGIKIMMDEILYLSPCDYPEEEDSVSRGESWSGVEVTVVGGYEDERGDAERNSLSLLRALHEEERLIEVRHFCVGPYNTRDSTLEERRAAVGGALADKTAILKGIALDLKSQMLFPAVFDWANFADFDLQIKDRLRMRMGGIPLDTEEQRKTRGSTFKPKSLRNRRRKVEENEKKEEEEASARPSANSRTSSKIDDEGDDDSIVPPALRSIFKVSLRPTGINENASFGSKKKDKILDFREREKEMVET